MGFRINTNVASLNAQTSAAMNNRNLDNSLAKLSSGLRINTAADDASGMAIADSLRSQASALGQGIANANDGIAIAQIADKAMDEQLKILDTIKVKATQAAQDGQSSQSRKALQADIKKLVEGLDNISSTTSFNGKSLLSGQFSNAEFQVGAYANQTIGMTIGATSSDKIGQARFETSAMGSTLHAAAQVTYTNSDGDTIALESATISTGAGTGIGVLAETINKSSDATGVSASWSLTQTDTAAMTSGTTGTVVVNGVTVADALDVEVNDKTGVLVDAINSHKETTGVVASVDERGRLELSSTDGRAVVVSGLDAGPTAGMDGTYTGRLTLTASGAADIQMTIAGATDLDTTGASEESIGLREMMGQIDNGTAEAMGAFTSDNVQLMEDAADLGAGVTTMAGAQAMMTIADSAIGKLDSIRADIGSAQNQMVATVNNISVTQVNVKAAESNIRDVDFAAESAAFSKYNILAQSGSYAMSQANAVQQNVLRLLQ